MNVINGRTDATKYIISLASRSIIMTGPLGRERGAEGQILKGGGTPLAEPHYLTFDIRHIFLQETLHFYEAGRLGT